MKKCIMTSTALVALAVVRICGFASSSHESKAFEPTVHAFFPFCI
jgi:transcriptional regulator GlxA family with amidase domain